MSAKIKLVRRTENIVNKYTFAILIIIFILAFSLRFYKISTNPPGLYWDEVSIGYNAYSVLKTGRDEHGKFLPLTFKAFGEYKLPVYIYAGALSISIFGPTEIGVRMPSAIAGALTVILLYFLSLELFASRRLALIASFLLAINPWHLQFSRAAFEANLALSFIVLGTLLFLKSKKGGVFLLLSSVLFSLTFYTYSTARFFTLIFTLLLFLIFRNNLWKNCKPQLMHLLSFFVFLGSYLGVFLSSQIFTRFTVVSAFHELKVIEWPLVFLKNYFSYFSFDFLFFQGDQISRHGIEKMGNLYFFQIPLLLIGLKQLVKTANRQTKYLIFGWLLLAPIPAALTQPSPHSLRSLNMIVPLTFLSALGLSSILSWLKLKFKTKFSKFTAYTITIALVVYFFLNYFHHYYRHYPKTSGLAWQEGNKEMALEVLQREKNYNNVFISDFLGQTYLYLLFYGEIDPDFYQKNRTADGFYKYHFVGKQWPKNFKKGDLLVLSFDDKFQPKGLILKEIKISNGDLIYRLWESE